MKSRKEPRYAQPLELTPEARAALKNLEVTSEDVKDVILAHKDLRVTYLFSSFDGAVVSEKVPAAAVMVHKMTRRLTIVINPKFLKRCMLSVVTTRMHRASPSLSRAEELGTNYALSTPEQVKEIRDHVLETIIRYEFSHIWFHHIERESKLPEKLLELVHGSLAAHHMKIDLGMLQFLPISGIFTSALMFPRWVGYIRGLHYSSPSEFNRAISELKYKETMRPDSYTAMRCFESLRGHKSELHTDAKLAKDFFKYAKAVDNYSEGIVDLADRLVSMFPELEDKVDNPIRPPPRGPSCGQSAGAPPGAAPSPSGGGGGDQPEEDEQPEGQEDPEEPPGPDGPGPEPDPEPEDRKPQQIDPRKEELEEEGECYVPLSDSDIPPDFDENLEQVLKAAGAGGKFISKTLKETEEAKLNNDTLKAVLKVSTKSLLQSAKKMLDLHRKPSSVVPTLVPNNHPVISDMVLNNSLMLHRPPRYKPSLVREDEIRKKKVRIYIDVSYSMQNVWPEVLGFVLGLRNHCDLMVFQFSTEIVEVSIDELKSGKLFTRGGTCVTPIVEDIVEASRVCDAFTVLGDRAYSGMQEIPKAAQTLTLLDIGYTSGREKAWFRTTDKCLVHYANLDDDFVLTGEGTVERTTTKARSKR